MTAIAFDTSLSVTSACVARDDGAIFSTPAPPPARLLAPAEHSRELLPEVERLVKQSGTDWGDVESIAVGVGPGTFTGLRIGVATARALGQALGIGLRPVSSLEALAEGVMHGGEMAARSLLLSAIDARRGQVFAALYRSGEAARSGGAPALRLEQRLDAIWEPLVLDPHDLLARIVELDEAPVCVGDWALKARESLDGAGAAVPPPDSGLHAVDAVQICRIGLTIPSVPLSEVHPVYLRLPDAEINRRLAR